MTEPNLEELLAVKRRAGRRSTYSPEVAEARRLEQNRRSAKAQDLAHIALAKLHHDDHIALYRQALDKINAERGPLPGDADYTPNGDEP